MAPLPLFQTSNLDIVDAPANLSHRGRARRMPPCFIYLHATAGTDSLKWLRATSSPAVSCHRLIAKDGTIYKILPDELMAWTQGYGWMGERGPGRATTCNTDGLSLEFENTNTGYDPYPLIQVLQGARQCYEWWGLYGLLPILNHADVDPRKDDPRGFPRRVFDGYLRDLIRGIHHDVLRGTIGE
jgi:N-acetyl-anhydromuramyl-L-alanine amidase AmpD